MPARPLRTRSGHPYPPGATWDGAGVNFALFSEHATGVSLCLLLADLVSYNGTHHEANDDEA